MKPSLFSGKKATSPLIGSVILFTIILVVAISSTIYFTSVEGGYSSVEQMEVRSLKVHTVSNLKSPTNNVLQGSGWNLLITLKNIGKNDVKINHILLNDNPLDLLNAKPLDDYYNVAVFDGSDYVKTGEVSIVIKGGSSVQISIAIKNGEDKSSGTIFSPGSNIEIKLQSTSGIYYTTSYIKLPS